MWKFWLISVYNLLFSYAFTCKQVINSDEVFLSHYFLSYVKKYNEIGGNLQRTIINQDIKNILEKC